MKSNWGSEKQKQIKLFRIYESKPMISQNISTDLKEQKNNYKRHYGQY